MSEEKENTNTAIFIVLFIVVILSIAAVIFLRSEGEKEIPNTIEGRLLAVIEGDLPEDLGYLYNDAYPFIILDDFWYTQVQSPKGTNLFQVSFRYGPHQLEDIPIEGAFDGTLFDSSPEWYITFDPDGGDFTYVSLAVSDFDSMMVKVFSKRPVAACTNTNDKACEDRPIITCENEDVPVVYFRVSNETGVFLENNCIILSGREFDIVKSTDRFLLNVLGIME
ncbi:hypothetical protein ACFLZX_04645 [Nanoarchaeota archaeon]